VKERKCKSRGCNWPVNRNEDICEECAEKGPPAQQRKDALSTRNLTGDGAGA
jgi:hypothetical protein